MWSLGFLFACVDPGDSGGASQLGPLGVQIDAALPNVLHTSWTAGTGRSRVEYGLDGSFDQMTPWSEQPAVTVLGLKSGRTYSLRADTILDDGAELRGEPVDVAIAGADPNLPVLTIADADADAWAGAGFVLLSLFQTNGSWLAIVDRDGDYVWVRPARTNTAIPTAHFTPDGNGIVYVDNDFMGYGWGGIGHVSFDGSVDEFRELPNVHHDVIELPGGSYAWLEMETREIVTEEGDTATFTTDAVYDAPTFDGEPRRVFSMFDDYGHTPWHVCSHSAIEVPFAGGEDYTHGNSLVYDEGDDAYLYMPKHLDAIVALDREHGAVDWQAGGRFGTFTDLDGDTIDPDAAYEVDGPNRTWWSHGHFSDAWPGGFALYDNGTHHSPLITRAVAYDWDTSSHTLRRTFAFSSEAGSYDPVLGDVRRLDNGNYLIAWTMSGMLTEVTPEGAVVWRASTSLGTAIGRVGYLPTLYGG